MTLSTPSQLAVNSAHSGLLRVWVLLAIGPAIVAAAAPAKGQDRVVLQRGNYSGRIIISGVIEDYTGKEILIRQQGETLGRYPASEVVEIETPQTESHTRGLLALADARVDVAIREFETALKKEPRAWVRREVLALLVRSALRQGDYSSAAGRFLALVTSDPSTRHFRTIPLAWTAPAKPGEFRGDATAWLKGSNEVARLIGASLLYDDAEGGPAARDALRELSASTDDRIRSLAQAQNWRREALSGSPGQLQLRQWQERIDELPEELRAGPTYLLGRAYAARHDYELAAATLLWLPLTDDHDFRLAARACLEAGTALSRIGQHAEALTLFREVINRFADTPSANEARELLEAAARQERESKGIQN